VLGREPAANDSCGDGNRTHLDPETERVRAIYDRNARKYDRDNGRSVREGRAWLAGQARGETLEVGCGTGRTLEFYPPDVRLTGIEISSGMLSIARERAASIGIAVDLRLGDARALPFPDASFDTVAFSFSLCTISEPDKAVGEAVRVLRPRGRLVALEHVRSPIAIVRFVERLVEPLTVRFSGDHLLREPIDLVTAHRLEIVSVDRFRLGVFERLVATKPGT